MSAARRYLEVLAFVGVWMAAGWICGLGPNAYLLVGVPLVVFFQLIIRRQPLRLLWARDVPYFRLGSVGILLAGLLVLAPGYDFIVIALPKRLWVVALWLICASAGAVYGAFALQEQRVSSARRALPSFLIAVVIGTGLMAANGFARHHPVGITSTKLLFLVKQFLLYFVVSCVLEEVAFRGALDSHVYRVPENEQQSNLRWFSAIFVSALWGIWHLPTLPMPSVSSLIAATPILIIVHTLVGVPISFCWRSGGTLALPAIAHALIDAYRNVIR